MPVSVITSTEPKNANIYLAAAVGTTAGVAVRQFLPVTQPEIDSVLFGEYNAIKENTFKQTRRLVMANVSKMKSKAQNNKQAVDLFFDRIKASIEFSKAQELNNEKAKKHAVAMAKKAKEAIKNAPDAIKKEISELTQKALNQFKASRLLSGNSIKTAVKHQRPWGSFLLPGAALATLCAYTYNVVGAINKD